MFVKNILANKNQKPKKLLAKNLHILNVVHGN